MEEKAKEENSELISKLDQANKDLEAAKVQLKSKDEAMEDLKKELGDI